MFLLLATNLSVDAQVLGVKTNALLWATASPNLSAEVGLAPRWTFELAGEVNPFTYNDNRKWKHYLLQGEARYWLCQRFYGHFLGLHAGGGEFNVSRISVPWLDVEKDYRYEGWTMGVGLSYGYSWILGRRWNLEAELGLGWTHLDYEKFKCATCGSSYGREKKDRFAPTKIAINLIYMIK